MNNSVKIISNYNVDLIVRRLQKKTSDYRFSSTGYNQWIQFLTDKLSEVPSNLFILLDGEFLLYSEDKLDSNLLLDSYLNLIDNYIQVHKDCIVFISTLDINPRIYSNIDKIMALSIRDYWNNGLLKIAYNAANCVIFDILNLVSDYGRAQLYSDKSLYLQSSRLSLSGMDIVSNEIIHHLDMLYKPKKKLLVIDLDNTIWGGVLSEVGYQGVDYSSTSIGRIYSDVQRIIKQIKNTGILLAVASKNDLSEVISAFDSGRFALTRDDFVSIYADWNDKSLNLKRIADDINISIDSVVFLDDSEIEREKVRISIPDVIVADFPKEIEQLPNLLTMLFKQYFQKNSLTTDDLLRNESYFAETKRKKTSSKFQNINDFIKSLGIKAVLSYAKSNQYTRISQLIERTNQFNLTNNYYSIAELHEYVDRGNLILIGNVSDSFGSYGDVFVIMITTMDKQLIIDNLLMSCRVMGKNIEFSFMKLIENLLINLGYKSISASYIRSKKNTPVAKLYDKLNFELVDSDLDGNRYYTKQLQKESNIETIYEARFEIE
jgi:FkbH-like protein